MVLLIHGAMLEFSGPSSCAHEGEFKAAVAARLGHDPFAVADEFRIRVEITESASRFSARLELIRGVSSLGQRALGPSVNCQELFESAAVAAAVALDPLVSPSAKPVADTTASVPPEVAPPSLPPSRTPLSSLSLGASLGALGAFGFGPTLTAGGWLEARVHLARWSLGLGLAVLAPSSVKVDQGSGGVFTGLAELTVCRELLGLTRFGVRLCGVGLLGAMRVEGHDLPQAGGQTVAFAELGGRIAANVPLLGGLGLTSFVEVSAPLRRLRMVYGSDVVWEMPWATATAGIAGDFSWK